NAERDDILRLDTRREQEPPRGVKLPLPNLHWILLDPSGMRIVADNRTGLHRDRMPSFVVERRPGAGCSFVKRQDKWHRLGLIIQNIRCSFAALLPNRTLLKTGSRSCEKRVSLSSRKAAA